MAKLNAFLKKRGPIVKRQVLRRFNELSRIDAADFDKEMQAIARDADEQVKAAPRIK